MTEYENYQNWLAMRTEMQKQPHSDAFFDQEKRYVEPFRMYGNVYYVGDNWICGHLIDTGDGLLLMDAGNCGGAALLIHTIWKMGFDPSDIKWLILSHAHVDHIGAASFMKNLFGTKLYLGARDAYALKERPDLVYIQGSADLTAQLFEPDVLIHDNDVIKFGNTEVRFREVPGHTAGCIACFFDAVENGITKRCGYFGGFGFNTIAKDILLQYGDTSFYRRREFMESLKKVEDEPVDIFLGNHVRNNKVLEKRRKMLENPEVNPFIDPNEWKAYMIETEEKLQKFMDDPKNN